jgi:protein-disulfide isomerase
MPCLFPNERAAFCRLMFAALCAGVAPLVAAAPAASNAPPPPSAVSLQDQIDDLKRTQGRILEELQALRALLQNAPAPARSEMPALPPPPTVLNVRGEPFKGAAAATLAIVEYSDFDCSHCAEFATRILPALDRKYVATGNVKLFFRDLPERGSESSLLKARLARCAGEEGKFWVMHDHLFAARPAVVGEKWRGEAEAIGLDVAKVAACLDAGRWTDPIQRSATGAVRMGFRGTPTFVVGRLDERGEVVRVHRIVLGLDEAAGLGAILDELLAAPATK